MTMKHTQLKTHWNADDAYTVISFLDELRDLLWAAYGDDIIEMLQDASSHQAPGSDPESPGFNDDIAF
jgi:hypothetical protein